MGAGHLGRGPSVKNGIGKPKFRTSQIQIRESQTHSPRIQIASFLKRRFHMARTRVLLTARDIMTRSLITLSPELSIFDAMSILMTKRISGAPVVDDSGLLIGMLSELDCLRVLSSDDFYADEQEAGGCVRDFMKSAHRTIGPHLGLYAIAHYFLTTSVRRLPVVAENRLLGQVSRRDVLRGIEKMRRARQRGPVEDYLSVARSWSAL